VGYIPDEVDGFLSGSNPGVALTEMSSTNFPGGEGRQTRKADNLTAISEPIYKMW
jgi:hypothetical protein